MVSESGKQGVINLDRNKPIALPTLKFGNDRSFETELHRRVYEYFDTAGKNLFATVGVYIKAFSILVLFLCAYLYLVFAADNLWKGMLSATLLGFAVVGIGANLQHDGSHNAYSRHRAINKLMALSIELIGASSYFWQWKHNRIHHRYTNISAFDTDIDFGALGRIAPAANRLWFHRRQHLYIWLFYGLLTIKWQLFDDFRSLIAGRLGFHRIPRPGGRDLVLFIGGKVFFFTIAFAVPLLYHPVLHVLFFYFITMSVAGFILSMIFVLPHCAGESEFPLPDKTSGRMAYPRAVHQVRVTVDFSRNSPAVTWLTGGLNFHREHHLFPGICHVHYSRIAGIIDVVCDEFGIPHKEHKSYAAGLAAHYRWLRTMGSPTA
ncbi:MAG: acyl-CoA desaturase [Chitinispirillaceae bacterium]|nr:acyl-CoA desaturase [Chitinispirillaceae bacterium]